MRARIRSDEAAAIREYETGPDAAEDAGAHVFVKRRRNIHIRKISAILQITKK
jgi:hypothetical protein